MPKKVERCVKSVLEKNPDMEEPTAWAICVDLYKKNKLGEDGTPTLSAEEWLQIRIDHLQRKLARRASRGNEQAEEHSASNQTDRTADVKE